MATLIEAEEVEESISYTEIEKLETVGIVTSDIVKLRSGGVLTVEALRMRTKKARNEQPRRNNWSKREQELCGIRGLSEAKVDKILDASRKLKVGP